MRSNVPYRYGDVIGLFFLPKNVLPSIEEHLPPLRWFDLPGDLTQAIESFGSAGRKFFSTIFFRPSRSNF